MRRTKIGLLINIGMQKGGSSSSRFLYVSRGTFINYAHEKRAYAQNRERERERVTLFILLRGLEILVSGNLIEFSSLHYHSFARLRLAKAISRKRFVRGPKNIYVIRRDATIAAAHMWQERAFIQSEVTLGDRTLTVQHGRV